ncbi:MAG: 2OG-Fe(II) oxygenase, partial [Cyanobacteria bacterium CAN_BIN43]|nr:2OG-Fe(II) oxygenase [Cyanobacteria bacterium CAN_BIN43]
MSYYHLHTDALPIAYLSKLQRKILSCPYFAVNNLNRDFVGTKGFSVVFRRSHISTVEQQFPYFQPYLERALQPDCNAFYLNPLLLKTGSRVDPHIDRSLRSY